MEAQSYSARSSQTTVYVPVTLLYYYAPQHAKIPLPYPFRARSTRRKQPRAAFQCTRVQQRAKKYSRISTKYISLIISRSIPSLCSNIDTRYTFAGHLQATLHHDAHYYRAPARRGQRPQGTDQRPGKPIRRHLPGQRRQGAIEKHPPALERSWAGMGRWRRKKLVARVLAWLIGKR